MYLSTMSDQTLSVSNCALLHWEAAIAAVRIAADFCAEFTPSTGASQDLVGRVTKRLQKFRPFSAVRTFRGSLSTVK